MKIILFTSLYFLALINPASKIFLLSSMEPPLSGKKLFSVCVRATFVALIILTLLMLMGNFLLKEIFHVEIYSLRIAGGIVLFLVGLTAIRKGRFYEKEFFPNADISIVPLGAPLIAGPGTIACVISFASKYGPSITISALSIALLLNFLIMLSSQWIGKTLEKLNAVGPLIRLTGLIVMSVSVQMVLDGIGEWKLTL